MGYAQDSPAVTDPVTVLVTDPVTEPTDSSIADPSVIKYTDQEVSGLYIQWFINPLMFSILILLITGLVIKVVNLKDEGKQYASWGIGIVAGTFANLMGWGMFEGLTIFHAAIVGFVHAGGSNLLYKTGAFNKVLGVKKN
ncbi:MAG: hypothetical protein DWQ44_09030 [Bacteroidetes bacterium]|nr:MAG: hypothetical protein DWQ33_02745 [Bacteroidota bacterium]REK06433.1 MAG: hypothetical protein DWQ39_02820 [Bacteroidota bacterium]REK33199.1 MAG: hypothetical protein DWQ44_09030 [Bacteroidota bacterium]REK47036.1 MAG: hypothetical protein DWQ48_13365 [Bacteroidota bacterium]